MGQKKDHCEVDPDELNTENKNDNDENGGVKVSKDAFVYRLSFLGLGMFHQVS